MARHGNSRKTDPLAQHQARRRALLLRQLTGRPAPAPGVPEERRMATERRAQTVWSMFYGGLRPRRRRLRRAGEDTRLLLDWHEPKVLYLAITILLMSCADALFTLNLLAAGGEEVNTLMRSLIENDIRAFLLAKIGLTAISVVLLVIAANREVMGGFSVRGVLKAICLGYATLLCYELYLLGWEATGVADELQRQALHALSVAVS